MEDKEISEIKTQVAVLNNTIQNLDRTLESFDGLHRKFENTITRMSQIETSLMLLDQKMETAKSEASLRRRESESSIREIKSQMETMSMNNEKIFNSKMDRIFTELKEIRLENKKSFSEVYDEIKENNKELRSELDTIELRISKLENWRWWIMGIGVAVTTFITFIWKSVFN